MDRIVRIDMGAPGGPKAVVRPIGEYAGLGGRAMTATVVWKEVPAGCSALGSENKLVIAPGLLAGSRAAGSGRIAVGCKSPQTGAIEEVGAGGAAAAALARLGYAAVIIEGRRVEAGSWKVLIGPTGVRVVRAEDCRMLPDVLLWRRLAAAYGEKIAVLCCGADGRMRSLAEAPLGRSPRPDGRRGVGAVMGAKGVGCIVVDAGGATARSPRDPARFQAANRRVVAGLRRRVAGRQPAGGKSCHRGCVLRCGGQQNVVDFAGLFEEASPWMRQRPPAGFELFAPEGRDECARDLQVATAAFSAAGYCLCTALAALDRPEIFQAMLDTINGFAGLSLTPGDMAALGRNILRKECDFRAKAASVRSANRASCAGHAASRCRAVALLDEDWDGVWQTRAYGMP